MARAKSTKRSNDTSANIGFEKKLWLAADSRSEPETAEGNRSSGIAIRGIEADLGDEQADTFRRDLHPDLRADFVLANGSMSSNQSGEGEIRRAIIEADLVNCMVALPGQLSCGEA
jgi:type I restriction-modification system DNA methylase subunit